MLAGANEDYAIGPPNDKHWVRFVPAPAKDKLGYVGFGYHFSPIFEQAAMNEAGLFYDYNALARLETPNTGKPTGGLLQLRTMITSCHTVEQAVAYLTQFDFPAFSTGQMVIGDATGASAILERHTVTRRPATTDFQIGTNFRTSTTPKTEITCWRYKTCEAGLLKRDPVTVESVRALLAASMPPKGGGSISWYTTVADLKAGIVHLFRKGDFSRVAHLRLKEELAKPARTLDMDDLMATRGVAYPQEQPNSLAEHLASMLQPGAGPAGF